MDIIITYWTCLWTLNKSGPLASLMRSRADKQRATEGRTDGQTDGPKSLLLFHPPNIAWEEGYKHVFNRQINWFSRLKHICKQTSTIPYACPYLVDWLIELCFTPLSTVFQSYHCDSSHHPFLSWVSQVLGWGSEVSCPRTPPTDPVRLEPRTPLLRVKHFTPETRETSLPPHPPPPLIMCSDLGFTFRWG